MSIHLAFFDLAETFTALMVIASGASAFLLALLTIVVHVVSAIAVYRDGQALRMRAHADDRAATGTILVVPEIWAAATLVIGIAMLAGYWILHHTTFFERRVRSLGGLSTSLSTGTSATDAAPVG
jgi:hypothetical protein